LPDKALPHAAAAQRLTEYAEELLNLEGQLALDPKHGTTRQRMAELYDLLGQPEKSSRIRRRRAMTSETP